MGQQQCQVRETRGRDSYHEFLGIRGHRGGVLLLRLRDCPQFGSMLAGTLETTIDHVAVHHGRVWLLLCLRLDQDRIVSTSIRPEFGHMVICFGIARIGKYGHTILVDPTRVANRETGTRLAVRETIDQVPRCGRECIKCRKGHC